MISPRSGQLPPWLASASVQPASKQSRQWWPAQALGHQQTNTAAGLPKKARAVSTSVLVQDDEESLEELTALCMQTGEQSPKSVESEDVDNSNDLEATVTRRASDDLDRAGTQDSPCTAHLLSNLQAGYSKQQELAVQAEQGSGDPNSSVAASKADAAMLTTPEEVKDDMPLVSSRKNSILDIMCGRAPSNIVGTAPTVMSPLGHKYQLLQPTVSSASNGSNSFFIGTGTLGATASDSSMGSTEPWGGLGASLSAASVPSVLSAASTSGGAAVPFAPLCVPGLVSYTAEAAEACRLLYLGVFLTPASRDVLLSLVPALHPLLRGDHMTLVFRPSVVQLLQYPLGASVELRVLGSAGDARVQAVFVEAPAWLETASASAHITISVAAGAKAVEAGQLIHDALQLAAEVSDTDPSSYATRHPGTYQHFEEPLPLVGRLGVKLAVPSATAVSMGWSTGAGLGQLLPGSEAEVVAYSVKELAASGCFNIGADNLQEYHKRHGHLLGGEVPASVSPSALALPAGPEAGGNIMDLFPRMTTPEVPDDDLPAAAATTPMGRNPMVPQAMFEACSPVLQCPAGGGAFAAATATAAAGSSNSPLLVQSSPSCTAVSPFSINTISKTPGSPAVEAVESPPDSPKSSSSASSTSSTDAVQFLSSVHEGDYVALRPFVPDGQERLHQGYVREFACFEPFQPEGVLVVMTDDTIGYVAMVLDSANPSRSSSSSTPALAATNSKKRSATHSIKDNSGSSKALSVAYPVDPTSAPGTSDPQAAGVQALSGGSGGSIEGPLKDWILSAGSLEAAVSVVSRDMKRRNAADAERDLQLWREFEALQRQHGESLCNSILESCNHDFAEAMELIKAQASTLQATTAAAAAAAASSPKVAASPGAPAAAAAPQSTPAGGAGGATAADEGLVQQLALSLRLVPRDALQLARLVPHMPAERVVQELQKQCGDVGAAADALLSTAQPAAAAGSSGRVSPVSVSDDYDDVMSPEVRAAPSFMSSKDPARVMAVQQLREMSPGLTFDLADMLLEEHGGDVSEASQALADMQTHELQARTAAALACNNAADIASSSSTLPTATAAAGASGLGGAGGLSEADQLAILAAMGEFETEPQQQQPSKAQTTQLKGMVSPVFGSPTRGSPTYRQPPPAMPLPGPAYYAHPAPGMYQQHPYRPAAHLPPPPPPPPRAAVVESFVDMEVKRKAKEAADALYEKAKLYNSAADVMTTAAQDAIKGKGDKASYRKNIEEANKLRQQAKAAIQEAQRVAWSANNNRSSVWEVDLHGLGVTKAIAQFAKQFKALQLLEHPGGVLFRVIVGQGKHSEDKVPKIKLGILQYLDEQSLVEQDDTGKPWGITWEVDPTNPGVINVHIPADTQSDA